MRRGNARLLLNAVFAASIEGLSPQERADFVDALRDKPSRPQLVRSRPPVDRPALRSVPAMSSERVSAERLAAIRQLGGDIDLETGA